MNKDEIVKAYEKMVKADNELNEYDIEYATKEVRLMFDGRVSGLSNQSQRDAMLKKLLIEEGDYQKLSVLKAKAKHAYYWWRTVGTYLK